MMLLFLCSQKKRRSLTAEKIFDGYNGHEARSFMDRELVEIFKYCVYNYI